MFLLDSCSIFSRSEFVVVVDISRIVFLVAWGD